MFHEKENLHTYHDTTCLDTQAIHYYTMEAYIFNCVLVRLHYASVEYDTKASHKIQRVIKNFGRCRGHLVFGFMLKIALQHRRLFVSKVSRA